MPYTDLPTLYQIRNNAIISYPDFSYAECCTPKEREYKQINSSGKFTISAQKRLKRIIDIWLYSLSEIEMKYSFVTVTISSKMDNKINHNKMVKTLIEKLLYRYGYFNYVWKAELQENGNIHYHFIMDMEIDWKIVRRQWNKIQSFYVDKYQMKMKQKYSKGYYFDVNMVDKNGNTISDEIQYKRYQKGNKANWRNPNSTDVKIVDTTKENVGAYVGKYVGKIEEDKDNTTDKIIKRWWGSNDELKLIKYAVISSESIEIELLCGLENNTIKIVEENYKIKCKIHERIKHDTIENAVRNCKLNNQNILIKNRDINARLIEKEVRQYNKMYKQ